MRIKNVITILLLLFVATSVGYLLYQEVNNEPNAQAEESISGTRYITYYFRRTMRCPTCINIENYTGEAIKIGFAKELNNKQLEWRNINIEDKGNEHFEDDYQLYAQSVVLVEIRDGQQQRWKNLEQIWDMVGNKDAFISYIQEEIKLFMGKGS
jgi:hypothetical protein